MDEDHRHDEGKRSRAMVRDWICSDVSIGEFVFLRSTCAVWLRRFTALRQGEEGQTAGRIADEACVAMRSAWRPRPVGGAKKRCECLCACCGSWYFGGRGWSFPLWKWRQAGGGAEGSLRHRLWGFGVKPGCAGRYAGQGHEKRCAPCILVHRR